jgi:hypothetical protein
LAVHAVLLLALVVVLVLVAATRTAIVPSRWLPALTAVK